MTDTNCTNKMRLTELCDLGIIIIVERQSTPNPTDSARFQYFYQSSLRPSSAVWFVVLRIVRLWSFSYEVIKILRNGIILTTTPVNI